MSYYLPEKFYFKHQFAFFLHDIIAKIVKSGEEKNIFYHSVILKNNEETEKLKKISNFEILDYLSKSGYDSDVDEIIKKQIFDAILSDFLHYVYTALETSEKAKLSVSFALLRKPFKDNLFILEWLLADPHDFLKKFKSANSNTEIAIDGISPERKKSIIASANSKVQFPFLPSDILYEIRYDKAAPHGLESIWNKANHLITSSRNFSTEDMNLNFIFSQENDKINQWERFYTLLPGLLMQTIFISDALYRTFSENSSVVNTDLILRILYGFDLANKQFTDSPNATPPLTTLPLFCEKCNTEIQMNEIHDVMIYKRGYFKCFKGHKIYLFEI